MNSGDRTRKRAEAAVAWLLTCIATLPVILSAASSGKGVSMVLLTAALYLVAFGLAGLEVADPKGIIRFVLATGPLRLLLGSAPFALAFLFYKRTGEWPKVAAVFVLALLFVLGLGYVESRRAREALLFIASATIGVTASLGFETVLPLLPAALACLIVLLILHNAESFLEQGKTQSSLDLRPPIAAAAVLLLATLLIGSSTAKILTSLRQDTDRQVARQKLKTAIPATSMTSSSRTSETQASPGGSHRPPPGEEPQLTDSARPPATRQATPETAPGLPASETPEPSPQEQPTPHHDKRPPSPTEAPEPAARDGENPEKPTQPTTNYRIPSNVTPDTLTYGGAPIEEPRTIWDRLNLVRKEILGLISLVVVLIVFRFRKRRRPAEENQSAPAKKGDRPAARTITGRFYRLAPKDPRSRIIHYYNRVFEAGRTIGIENDKSSEEVAAILADRLPAAQFQVLILARSFEQACYSREAIPQDLSDHAEEAATRLLEAIEQSVAK